MSLRGPNDERLRRYHGCLRRVRAFYKERVPSALLVRGIEPQALQQLLAELVASGLQRGQGQWHFS